MSFISYLIPQTLREVTFAGATGVLGKQYALNMAYQYAPSMITKSVMTSARATFGSIAGSLVGSTIAPIAVAQHMPYILMGANVAGGYVGYQGGLLALKAGSYAIHKFQERKSNAWLENVKKSETEKSSGEISVFRFNKILNDVNGSKI